MYKWRKWRLWKKSSFPVDLNCIYSQLYLPPFCHNSSLFFVLRGLTLLDDIHQHHDHLPNNVLVPPFSVKTVLSHWGMESSRPLNVCCGICTKMFPTDPLSHCKVGPLWIGLVRPACLTDSWTKTMTTLQARYRTPKSISEPFFFVPVCIALLPPACLLARLQ